MKQKVKKEKTLSGVIGAMIKAVRADIAQLEQILKEGDDRVTEGTCLITRSGKDANGKGQMLILKGFNSNAVSEWVEEKLVPNDRTHFMHFTPESACDMVKAFKAASRSVSSAIYGAISWRQWTEYRLQEQKALLLLLQGKSAQYLYPNEPLIPEPAGSSTPKARTKTKK
jgi:hypothetical protein